MKFRSDDRYAQATYCDIGPYAGQYRAIGFVYGAREELDALFSARDVDLVVVPDGELVPDWWKPYAAEFDDWHAWDGAGGLLYARRPKSSPPKVVRGTTPIEIANKIRQGINDG